MGTFVGLGHPDVTEWLSRIGFDWLLLDAEHGPLDFQTLQVMMQSMNGSDCIPIVRPQWNDPVIIKRVLDIGAYGVLAPWINTKEAAENLVKYCKYPPEGIRGFGPRRAGMFDNEYYNTANDEIIIAAQIETQEALNNLDDILSVPGIDVCYIGPSDLSVSLGFGFPPNWKEPSYVAAFDQVLESAAKHGKVAGMFAVFDNIEWAIEKGFRFNTVDNVDRFITRAASMALDKAKGAMERRNSLHHS